jgi:ankyrin repeat protein
MGVGGAGAAAAVPVGAIWGPLSSEQGDFKKYKAQINEMYDAIEHNNLYKLRRLVEGREYRNYIDGFVEGDYEDELPLGNMEEGKLTPLHFAVFKKNGPAVAILLGAGANVNASIPWNFTGIKTFTPLHAAARMGNEGLIRLLLDRGADVNGLTQAEDALEAASRPPGDYVCITPLYEALRSSSEEAALLLLERGADPKINSCSAITELSEVRGEAGFPPPAIFHAKSPAMIRLLHEKRMDVNATIPGSGLSDPSRPSEKFEQCLLSFVAVKNEGKLRDDLVDTLLELGANVDHALKRLWAEHKEYDSCPNKELYQPKSQASKEANRWLRRKVREAGAGAGASGRHRRTAGGKRESSH